jgi:transcriptional regulator with XRE-family HTH domain
MVLADRLRARRMEMGLTQGQVARRAEMSNVQYNGYENRRHVPSDSTLERLAAALETSVEALRAMAADRTRSTSNEVRLSALLSDVRTRVAELLEVESKLVTVQISVNG